MIKIGFVVLAHDNIFRLRQVLSFLARQDVPIALHLDAKTSRYKREALEYFFKDYPRIYWVSPIRCEWGQWSIVEAQINATKLLLEKQPDLDYIYHISGSCLPLRPISELCTFLEENDSADFIESVSLKDKQWVYDGLSEERVNFYHPFNWQKNPRLFDLNVKFQRLLHIRRRIPNALEPAFGSQWWCLRASTLKQIFDDPYFSRYCKFFSKSWIPDESFFQTLARAHSSNLESRSLTYATFDNNGKPFLIYDDHEHILERLDRFFVRKIWRGASQLYSNFMDPQRKVPSRDQFAELEFQALLKGTRDNCIHGRPGLLAQFRIPNTSRFLETRNQYYIYVGFHFLRDQIYYHYYQSALIAQMGYLFHPNRTETELTHHRTPKNASDLHKLRDYHKLQFLVQRVWYSFPRQVAFLAKPHHLKKMTRIIGNDKNCTLIFIKGAWLLELFDRNIENIERMKTVCKIEARREALFLDDLSKGEQAKIHIYDIGDLMERPSLIAQNFPEQIDFSPPEINKEHFKEFLAKLLDHDVPLDDYDLKSILKKEANISAPSPHAFLPSRETSREQTREI